MSIFRRGKAKQKEGENILSPCCQSPMIWQGFLGPLAACSKCGVVYHIDILESSDKEDMVELARKNAGLAKRSFS